MPVSITPSFYVDRLSPRFREAIKDTYWETMIPSEDAIYVSPDTPLNLAGTYWITHLQLDERFPKLGPLPERIDADFQTHHPGSVYEAGLEALELAHIQLVSWGVPGLVSKCCLDIDDVMLREVRLTFWMQVSGYRRHWEVMHLSGIEDELPSDAAATIIYANASFEQSKWPQAVPSEDRIARIPDILPIEARLGEVFLKSYDLDALANWENVNLPSMCGTLFDKILLGAFGVAPE